MEVSGFESSHVIMSKKQAFLSGMFLHLNVGVMFLENDGMFGGCSYVVSTQLYVRMRDQRPTKWGDMLRKSKTPRESANFSRDLATNTWS